tara:strand:- start:99 stop:320 length:222 start_codon:yes stop_codon:yes gene_type:complete
MYRPVNKMTGTGVLGGGPFPAFICGAEGAYSFLSPGGVTFDIFVGANGQSEIIEIPISSILANGGNNVTVLSQ